MERERTIRNTEKEDLSKFKEARANIVYDINHEKEDFDDIALKKTTKTKAKKEKIVEIPKTGGDLEDGESSGEEKKVIGIGSPQKKRIKVSDATVTLDLLGPEKPKAEEKLEVRHLLYRFSRESWAKLAYKNFCF
jgi:hypothetical protein